MSKYRLCPICGLNYITDDEDMCKLCKQQGHKESMVDMIERKEQEKQTFLKDLDEKNKRYQDFVAIRYDVPHR